MTDGSLDDIPEPTEEQAKVVLVSIVAVMLAASKLIQECRFKKHNGAQTLRGKPYCQSCLISAVVGFENIKRKLEEA